MQDLKTPGEQLRDQYTRDNYIKQNHNDDDYIQKLKNSGIVCHKSVFPAFFQLKNGLLYPGMATKQLIKQKQIIVQVPEPLILSSMKALKQPALKQVFEHEFYKDQNWEDRVLQTYCLYLLTKNDKQNVFYHMVQHLPKDIDVLFLWSQEQLDKFIDKTVKEAAILDKQSFEQQWTLFKAVQQKFQILQKPQITYNNYIWIFVHITSRCFGKTMDCTSFVPFSQYFNHHSSSVYYQINLAKKQTTNQQPTEDQELSSNGSNQSQQYIESEDYAYDQIDTVTYKWGQNQCFDLVEQQKNKIRNFVAHLFQRLQTQVSWRDFSIIFAAQFINLVKIVQNQYIQGRKKFPQTISKLQNLQKVIEKYIQQIKQFYINKNGKNFTYKVTNRQNQQNNLVVKQQRPNPQLHKPDYTHFYLKTDKRDKFLPNNQVYFCYGKNSNRTLLLRYGFAIQGNKYEHFWSIFQLSPILKQSPDLMQRVQKLGLPIRIKFKINYVNFNLSIIMFFRLFNWHLFDMSSIDQIFYVLNCDQQVSILQTIVNSFKAYLQPYQDLNQQDLTDKSLSYHEYFIKVYNLQKKNILLKQIQVHEKLISILLLVKEGTSLQQSCKKLLTSAQKYMLRHYLNSIKI